VSEPLKKILVVDDEAQITRVLRRGLESAGYQVRTADDGRSGLENFRSWLPDLVITDLSMPGLDGLELCSRVRQLSEVPILVLSVREDETTKVKALDLGADDYVSKPLWHGGIDSPGPRPASPDACASAERQPLRRRRLQDRSSAAAGGRSAEGRFTSRPRSLTCFSSLSPTGARCSRIA